MGSYETEVKLVALSHQDREYQDVIAHMKQTAGWSHPKYSQS